MVVEARTSHTSKLAIWEKIIKIIKKSRECLCELPYHKRAKEIFTEEQIVVYFFNTLQYVHRESDRSQGNEYENVTNGDIVL